MYPPARHPAFERADEEPHLPVNPIAVARRAMQRVDGDHNEWWLLFEDIGVLAYHGDDSPDVVRLNPVAADTSHVRPFAVVSSPHTQSKYTIRFELFDDFGTQRFASLERYALTQGANFITTRTYLPLSDDRTSGQWTLRISIGERCLAEHAFIVRTRTSSAMRAILTEDGEVDLWLAQAIGDQKHYGGNLSLDDLLDTQSDGRESESSLR